MARSSYQKINESNKRIPWTFACVHFAVIVYPYKIRNHFVKIPSFFKWMNERTYIYYYFNWNQCAIIFRLISFRLDDNALITKRNLIGHSLKCICCVRRTELFQIPFSVFFSLSSFCFDLRYLVCLCLGWMSNSEHKTSSMLRHVWIFFFFMWTFLQL